MRNGYGSGCILIRDGEKHRKESHNNLTSNTARTSNVSNVFESDFIPKLRKRIEGKEREQMGSEGISKQSTNPL